MKSIIVLSKTARILFLLGCELFGSSCLCLLDYRTHQWIGSATSAGFDVAGIALIKRWVFFGADGDIVPSMVFLQV